MDIVTGVFQILSCLSAPSCNYIDRHRKFKRNVDDLRRRVRDLNSKKADIETQLKVVDLSEKQVRKQVEDWLGDVDRIINVEMPGIEEKVQRVSYLCRARIGGLVCEKIEAVEAISQQGNFSEGLVIDKPRPPTIGIPLPVGNLEGEVDVKEKIWGCLNNNEVGVIGVCGIGGVGKTTIIKHIHNESVKMKPPRFDIVIWVTVSHPLSIWKLQHDIVKEMGMERSLPENEEEMKQASRLMDIMVRRKFLLILDDVWDKLSLEDVGIPKPTKENGCKVVVTSRSVSVCNFLECRLVKVNPLSDQESLNLFLDKVGLGSKVMEDHDLGSILRSIVNECAGLPLAIVVIAGTMKGVSDVHEWRNALRELRKCVVGGAIEGLDDEMFNRLKFSYDRLLNSNFQNCFLWCSLYPEDHEIEKSELIEYWIDDGLIEELGSRKEMHDQGHTILNRLENNCLLEKCSKKDYVKMHDVVRDMALRIKSIGPQFIVKARMKVKKIPEEREWAADLEKICLMDNDIVDIPPSMSPKCPVLSTLLLQRNWKLKKIPECFFLNMPGLKVLNLSSCQDIEVLPTSICNLKNLTSLILRHCTKLKHVPSLAELNALQKLDMHEAGVEVVPEGTGMLINLQYLDLFCPNIMELPMGIFSNLIRLQHLCLHYVSKTEEAGVAGLSELEYFKGRLDIQEFSNFVKNSKHFEKFTYYCIAVGNGSCWQARHHSEHKGKLTAWLMECEVGGGNSNLLLPNNLEELEFDGCSILRGFNDIFLQNCSLNKLQRLKISRCKGIGCASLASTASISVFSNLSTVYIIDCPNLKKLFSVELLRGLQNLKVVQVFNCPGMEEIIGWEEDESQNNTTTTAATFTPQITCLEVGNLPELRSISPGREVMVFDFLSIFNVNDCPKLKRIPIYLAGNDQSSPPPALKKIGVSPHEWWESLEWDDPNAKAVLRPFVRSYYETTSDSD